MVFNDLKKVVALCWVGCFAVTVVRADDVLPKAPPASKYAKMAGHSPFVPPTAPVVAPAATPPPPAPGWADGLKATMILQDGDKYMVTVVDALNPLKSLYLTAEPDQATQMAVASVKWGANREEPPAITLRKGKEFAQVRYEVSGGGTGGANPAGGGPQIPGGVRNPVPGGQPFHSPLQASSVQNANQGPASNVIRRPVIRSQPAAPAPIRPGVNPPTGGIRPGVALPGEDDDDD